MEKVLFIVFIFQLGKLITLQKLTYSLHTNNTFISIYKNCSVVSLIEIYKKTN